MQGNVHRTHAWPKSQISHPNRKKKETENGKGEHSDSSLCLSFVLNDGNRRVRVCSCHTGDKSSDRILIQIFTVGAYCDTHALLLPPLADVEFVAVECECDRQAWPRLIWINLLYVSRNEMPLWECIKIVTDLSINQAEYFRFSYVKF